MTGARASLTLLRTPVHRQPPVRHPSPARPGYGAHGTRSAAGLISLVEPVARDERPCRDHARRRPLAGRAGREGRATVSRPRTSTASRWSSRSRGTSDRVETTHAGRHLAGRAGREGRATVSRPRTSTIRRMRSERPTSVSDAGCGPSKGVVPPIATQGASLLLKHLASPPPPGAAGSVSERSPIDMHEVVQALEVNSIQRCKRRSGVRRRGCDQQVHHPSARPATEAIPRLTTSLASSPRPLPSWSRRPQLVAPTLARPAPASSHDRTEPGGNCGCLRGSIMRSRRVGTPP